MKAPRKTGFFDMLRSKKPRRDETPPDDSVQPEKKDLVRPDIAPSTDLEQTPNIAVSPSILTQELRKFYSDMLDSREDINALLDKRKDLFYWGELEEIEREKEEEPDKQARFAESRKMIEQIYRDNAVHILLMPFNCPFKGFPTFEQYLNLLKLSVEKVQTLTALEKRKDKEGYKEDRLFNYRYGANGNYAGYTFTPHIVSDVEIKLLEKNNFLPTWQNYLNLIAGIKRIADEICDNITQEKNASCNLWVYEQKIERAKASRNISKYSNDFSSNYEYWNYIKTTTPTQYKQVGTKRVQNERTLKEIERRAPITYRDKPNFKAIPIDYFFSDQRIDYLLKQTPLNITLNLPFKRKPKKHLLLPRREQESHTYIVGGTKSGKSELLKYLAVQDIMKGDRNSVLFDPHGDIAEQISNIGFLYPNHVPNIIYVDTSIKEEIGAKKSALPCINPLDINKKYINTREKLEGIAYYLSIAFEEITQTENSVNMRAMLIPCLCVLLERNNSTLHDLDRFMDDDENEDLIALGEQSSNSSHARYFQTKFRNKKTQSTKEALSIRLQVLLNSIVFTKMTCGKTTLDFHEIVRGTNTHVIFRLNKENTAAIQRELGILIVTTIMNAAFTTKEHERQGMHLLIDEFQNFINSDMEKILSECRKYRVYLTLAHQYLDQIYSVKIRRAILANTNIKIIGSVGGNTVSSLKQNGEEQLEQSFVDTLRTGRFLMRIKSQGAYYDYLNVPSTLISSAVKWVDKKTKLEFLNSQYNRFYKSANETVVSEPVATVQKTDNTIDFNDF